MNTLEAKAANSIGSRQDHSQELSWIGLSPEEVKDRASAMTEVLVDILEAPDRVYWHHGGLNE